MKLTALVICKNEEELIRNALESVKDFDEIVVVDTGSTDKTLEIAREYTDKIFHFPWVDDFSKARNEAIKHATGDWLYSIDCDQVLLSSVEEVRNEAARLDNEGHKVALVKTLAGNNDEQVHFREILFKNDPDVYWIGAVHESLSVRGTEKTSIERRRGSSKSKLADPERNIRILENNALTPRSKFYLGRENYERGRYEEAIKWLLAYLEEGTWHPEVAEAYLTLARCYWFTQQGDKAREACMRAIKVNPDFKEALLLMSVMHFEPWKSKWKKIADQATNQDVLFIRN